MLLRDSVFLVCLLAFPCLALAEEQNDSKKEEWIGLTEAVETGGNAGPAPPEPLDLLVQTLPEPAPEIEPAAHSEPSAEPEPSLKLLPLPHSEAQPPLLPILPPVLEETAVAEPVSEPESVGTNEQSQPSLPSLPEFPILLPSEASRPTNTFLTSQPSSLLRPRPTLARPSQHLPLQRRIAALQWSRNAGARRTQSVKVPFKSSFLSSSLGRSQYRPATSSFSRIQPSRNQFSSSVFRPKFSRSFNTQVIGGSFGRRVPQQSRARPRGNPVAQPITLSEYQRRFASGRSKTGPSPPINIQPYRETWSKLNQIIGNNRIDFTGNPKSLPSPIRPQYLPPVQHDRMQQARYRPRTPSRSRTSFGASQFNIAPTQLAPKRSSFPSASFPTSFPSSNTFSRPRPSRTNTGLKLPTIGFGRSGPVASVGSGLRAPALKLGGRSPFSGWGSRATPLPPLPKFDGKDCGYPPYPPCYYRPGSGPGSAIQMPAAPPLPGDAAVRGGFQLGPLPLGPLGGQVGQAGVPLLPSRVPPPPVQSSQSITAELDYDDYSNVGAAQNIPPFQHKT